MRSNKKRPTSTRPSANHPVKRQKTAHNSGDDTTTDGLDKKKRNNDSIVLDTVEVQAPAQSPKVADHLANLQRATSRPRWVPSAR
ncbi:hypothetical protein [Phytohabitans rumicis]|uniref:Uncharacterized protein n=1 Tax=Phytohabitans rumicis TaxID=1076125 RepID=A0A6V8KTA5_9ACTN|nr:hypothetical protein [Phytohabitans rumicis]GFJ87054.1 hypothetical protein Prum_006960 [Phytohabitans rumicis]